MHTGFLTMAKPSGDIESAGFLSFSVARLIEFFAVMSYVNKARVGSMRDINRRGFISVSSSLLLANSVLGQVNNSVAQRKWAIVIGVNQYNHAHDLKHCVADSTALASTFRSLGFDSIFLLNDQQNRDRQPTKAGIETVLKQVVKEAQPADLVVVAFSGHGVGCEGSSYLCPTEANLRKPETTMVAIDELVEQLLTCSARQRVILMDACRNVTSGSGRAVEVEGLADWLSATDRFVPKIKPPRNQELALLASCDDRQRSYEDDQLGHGIFTHFLLDAMRGRAVDENGYVEVTRLFPRVRMKTKKMASDRFGHAQTPVQSGYIGAIRLGKFTTLIDEDFKSVDIGGLPAGPWRGDTDVLVDVDPARRKFLCATGDGGWVYASDIQVSGEFELRTNVAYNRQSSYDTNSTWIAFDQAGQESVPGLVAKWDARNSMLSVWFGILSPYLGGRRQDVKWATKQFSLKKKGAERQVEVELIVRRELVVRGSKTAARYKIVINGSEDDAITVARPDVTTFDQLGFFILNDSGNDRLQGIRRVQLMPMTGP